MNNQLQHRGIWKRFFHMCRTTSLPLKMLICYFILNSAVSMITVKVPEINGNFFTGDASVRSVSMFIGVELFLTVLSQTELYFNHIIRYKMNRNLRNALWAKILKLKPGYFDKTSSSSLISRITVDADSMNEFIMDIVLEIFFQIYLLVLTIAEMSTISIKAAFMLLGFIPLTFIFSFVMGRINLRFETSIKTKMSDMTSYLSEVISYLPLLKAFNTQAYERSRGKKAIDEYYKANLKVTGITLIGDIIGQLISIGPDIVIVLLGIKMLTAAEIDAAGWYMFYVYAGTFITFANSMGGLWKQAKATQGRLNKVSDILYEEEESLQSYVEEIVDSGDISFDNVTFAYEDKAVLDCASFTIPRNKNTVIIGHSGSGKSTILKLLGRMYNPNQGRIVTEGKNLSETDLKKWRDNIAFVVQNTPLLSGSIRDNILYGVKGDVTEEEINQAIEMTHLSEFIKALPEGLDYQVGQFGSRLSGGQRQKISVARAILTGAELMLLDEPTASLDITSTAEIIHTTDVLKGKRTIVEVTHDAKAIEHADHIIVVNKDHTVIEGDKEYIKMMSSFYKELTEGEV